VKRRNGSNVAVVAHVGLGYKSDKMAGVEGGVLAEIAGDGHKPQIDILSLGVLSQQVVQLTRGCEAATG
jgi:hypothetical protein